MKKHSFRQLRSYKSCMHVWYVHSAEVTSSPMWSVLKEVEDPELRILAEKLSNTILQSRTDSTAKKHLGAFCCWKIWASKHKLNILPTEVHHVFLYLQYLADSTNSQLAVEEAYNGLAWVHGTAGLSSATSSIFC